MHRRASVLAGAVALVAGAVAPISASTASTVPAAVGPAGLAAQPQPRDDNRYVDLGAVDPDDPKSFLDVTPDEVIENPNGTRIEVYGSVGDIEGDMDWRSVNAFAYLVNSVPAGAASYTTLFNSLYDGESVGYDSVTDQWTVSNPGKVFAPTAAYLNQANQYAATLEGSTTPDKVRNQQDRLANINVLGAKRSMDAAFANNSSLARLAKRGYGSSTTPKALDYLECKGAGSCLATAGGTNLMHSKFGAFEQAADSDGVLRDHVVWITSSNLNGSSGSRKSNLSIAIFEDETAYDAVADDIFGPSVEVAEGRKTALRAIQDNENYREAITVDAATNSIPGMSTESGVTLYPSPRALQKVSGNATLTRRTDVEATFLREQAAAGAGATPGCRLYTVHSLFNSSRGGVLTGLADLARQSCDVRVVLGTNAISDIVDGYFTMSTDLREVVDRVEFANVHDKSLSFSSGATNATFGGSSNFSGTALDYDELAFRADGPGVTGAVQEHSERLYQLAKGQVDWTAPRSVAIVPGGAVRARTGESVQLSSQVTPANGLVSRTTWSSSDEAIADVDPHGRVTGRAPGRATITVTIESPNAAARSTTKVVDVSADATTSAGQGHRATAAPVLTMDRYQGPASQNSTDITVTWGQGEYDYDGVVKLQYYSGGWKTYPTWVNVENGTGRISPSFRGSKTWRAFGARLDSVSKDGEVIKGGSTAKTKSAWSINTVRSASPSATPRLYATRLARSGTTVPMIISWARGGGTVRLQYLAGKKTWRTYATYRIPAGGNQILVGNRLINTQKWRLATSTGPLKVTKAQTISMR